MCLKQVGLEPNRVGQVCVESQIFLGVDNINGQFDVQGFIGLGPQEMSDHTSYVYNLFNQRVIERIVVGLNYENEIYTDKVSTITFGYYDWEHIEGGDQALNWYQNLGTDSWMVMMDDLMYDGTDLQTGDKGAKNAHIDSASMYIQVPQSEFNVLKNLLLRVDRTIK